MIISRDHKGFYACEPFNHGIETKISGQNAYKVFHDTCGIKEKDKMAVKEGEEKKTYKNKVVFLRKSKAGNHLFVFDSKEDLIAGGSLIMDVSEVERLIGGGTDWIKVSVLSATEAGKSAK